MITSKLVNYIKTQLQKGIDKETIKNILLSKGWKEEDIDQAFSIISEKAKPKMGIFKQILYLPIRPTQIFREIILENNFRKSLIIYFIFLLLLSTYTILLGYIYFYPNLEALFNTQPSIWISEALGILFALIGIFIFSLIVFLINKIFIKTTKFRQIFIAVSQSTALANIFFFAFVFIPFLIIEFLIFLITGYFSWQIFLLLGLFLIALVVWSIALLVLSIKTANKISSEQLFDESVYKKWNKNTIIISLVAFVILSAFPVYAFISPDSPPPDESMIMPKENIVPASQNAYYDLRKIDVEEGVKTINILKTDISEYIKGKEWNQELVDNILSSNIQTLKYFDQAIKKPKYQHPSSKNADEFAANLYRDYEDFRDSPMYTLTMSRELARLETIRVVNLFKQGKEKEAFNEALKIIELAQKIQHSNADTITYLVAIAIKNIGLSTIQRIIQSTDKIPIEKLIPYISYLEKIKDNHVGFKTAMQFEYVGSVKAMDIIFGKEKFENEFFTALPENSVMAGITQNNNYIFRPNETKGLLIKWLSPLIENSKNIFKIFKEDAEENAKKLPFIEKAPSTLSLLFEKNIMGKMLFSISATVFTSMHAKKCYNDFLISATQLTIAMKAYYLDNGRYPNSLEELVPKYISEIPKDPFDGGKIRYNKNTNTIYSIGSDLIDSKGEEQIGEYGRILPTKEPAVKIGF